MFMEKYSVAVYFPTPADCVREICELKYELEKVHGIKTIRLVKHPVPSLETEKGVISFYSKTRVENWALFGRKFSKLFGFPRTYNADIFGRELDHSEFHGTFLDYILEKEKGE